MFNQAQWIGDSITAPSQPNLWLCFRHKFTLESIPEILHTLVACDSKYWLWLNGNLVVREGGLKRGPAPDATYYDEIDLASYVKVGSNQISVLLWHFGRGGFSHADSGRAALLLSSPLQAVGLFTDAQWKVYRHPSFTVASGVQSNYRLSESNICFDARTDMIGWQQPDFDDSEWLYAQELGRASNMPWGSLHPRPIPQWRDYGVRAYKNAPALPIIGDGEVISLQLPYNCHFTPCFTAEAKDGGGIVSLSTDHVLLNYDSEPCVRAEYILRDGVQEHEAWGWMNGHIMHYAFPAGTKILSLGYRETGYDTDFSGEFECDDVWLTRAWHKAQRTLYVCMRDTFMDCPDRERAQWWGDAAIQIGECFYALDTRTHALARKGMLELARWQKPDGTLFAPIPGTYTAELPTQILASVGLLGFWNYYLHTGDRETIEMVYPAVKRYLELYTIQENGLIEERSGDWAWNDWGENKDQSLLYNGWYQLALQGQEQMALLLGYEDDLPFIRDRRSSIHTNFHPTFWNETEGAYRSPEHDGPPDERGQALAILAGLAPIEVLPRLQQVFREQYHASPYMEFYVLQALFQMGFIDDALQRLKKRFGHMVNSSDTTLWEFWEEDVPLVSPPSSFAGSRNHAWSGAPLTLISQYVVGIQPTSPGYSTFEVRPQLGALQHVYQKMESVKGKIEVEVWREPSGIRLHIEVPSETVANVILSANSKRHLIINGNLSQDVKGLMDLSYDFDQINLTLIGGRYELEV